MPVAEHALNILASLSDFADKQSNVVLDVLAGQTPHENEKFPKGELCFADSRWRGFYHCHPAREKPPQEHGHFHLFARCGEDQDGKADWTHVVALSIDNQGQPRSWFTVNQWVTGSRWLPAGATIEMLNDINVPEQASITEKFLLSMLGLYCEELKGILNERDRQLTQINANDNMGDTLNNREVYVLSSIPIDLQQRLHSAVSK